LDGRRRSPVVEIDKNVGWSTRRLRRSMPIRSALIGNRFAGDSPTIVG
jgi:hypothetical protein